MSVTPLQYKDANVAPANNIEVIFPDLFLASAMLRIVARFLNAIRHREVIQLRNSNWEVTGVNVVRASNCTSQ